MESLIESGEKVTIIDARVSKQYEEAHVNSAVNIPQEKLRVAVDKLDKNAVMITYCNKGVTGNAAQNILINKGFNKVYNLSGGHKTYRMLRKNK